MSQDAGLFIVLAFAVLAANLPFLFDRIFFIVRPASGHKGFFWRLLELFVLYLGIGVLTRVLERQAHGSAYPQSWEFYVTTLSLFVVFAFPGFVYRYLWHGVRRRVGAART